MGGAADAAPGTNPEQLFAAGYSACFGGALRLVARKQKIDPTHFQTRAQVSFLKDDSGLSLAVEMHASMPGVAREQGQALMEAAHQVCPYSKATRGNIPVTLVLYT